MEFCVQPPRFSVPLTSTAWSLVERVKKTCSIAVSAILTFFFLLVHRTNGLFGTLKLAVGTLLGTITGALLGQETESGFLRGAVVGAFSGAVFSIDVYESSLILWRSDESGIRCLLYLIGVIETLLSGRLVHERIGLASLNVIQSQMGSSESIFEEVQIIFDTSDVSVDKIPTVKIDTINTIDAYGERASCSVCLQVATDGLSSPFFHVPLLPPTTRKIFGTFQLARFILHSSIAFANSGLPARGDGAKLTSVPPHVPPGLHRPMAPKTQILPPLQEESVNHVHPFTRSPLLTLLLHSLFFTCCPPSPW
ncbi:hypothetical protein SAY87_017036 [Trapa incisa]|uniref:NEP1-interacting protein 1 n=1 Tax=Trapa incisa TaxID=236973 RepID=A0AAN7L9N3_9MYRT|nr:hypothetical protein SAY87_017036 [Trapa incisa]